MWINRAWAVGATLALGLSWLGLSLPAAMASADSPLTVSPAAGGLAVSLTGVPASATRVLVELESPLAGIPGPKIINFYLMGNVPVTGSSMTVDVPPSRLLWSVAAAQHGTVNLLLVAVSGTRNYTVFTSARLAPAGISAVSAGRIDRVSGRRVPGELPRLALGNPLICSYTLTRTAELVSRIGELHVAIDNGMEGSFNSGYKADNEVTVGVSVTGSTGSFSADGHDTLTNSIGADGGFTRGSGFVMYVDGHVYYGYYRENMVGCAWPYLMGAISSLGDAFPGTRSPPYSPYPDCQADPHGYVTLASRSGHWNDDRAQAYYYSGIASWFGFTFGGSNGYSAYVNEGWNNHGSANAYVCGNKYPMPDSSVFWNNGY